MMKRILTTLCLLAALRASASDPWWIEDVWSKPDRPFLYYGEGNPAETKKPEEAPVREAEPEPEPDPDDFSRFTTREALRAEYERRFDRALLDPTEANVASLQAATAHFFTLAQRFGEAWERTRIGRPEYDWTATNPTANFASTAASEAAQAGREAFARTMAREAGLLFIGADDDRLNALALGPVERFAESAGFELLAVTPSGKPLPGRRVKVLPENGIGRIAGESRPALFLVPRKDARHPALMGSTRPLRLGTGVLSVEAMKRNLLLILAPEREGLVPPLPGRIAQRMASGEAYRAGAAESPIPFKTETPR